MCVFVLLVWIVCTVNALRFIAAYSSKVPYADDCVLFYVRSGQNSLLDYLWSLHNEHRLPLPKLVQYLLYQWSGDIRSGMYLQALIYAATALGCILAARKLRGGSRPWDIFFALLWLQTGNYENLLMGFQLCIAIPGACVCSVLILGAFSERRLWPSHALACGAATLALPLCGGGGLLQAPALALWLVWLGWTQRFHAGARERRGARICIGLGLATIALCGLYLIGFHGPPNAQYAPLANSPLVLGLANLCAPFGPDYVSWRPVLMPAIASASALFGWLILRHGWRARDPRALGVCAVLVGGALLVCGIAFGRPVNGSLLVANRYIPLPAPFFVALTLGALCVLRPRWREAGLALACLLMLLATPGSIESGSANGTQRRIWDAELQERVEKRAGRAAILESYALDFMLGQPNLADWLLRHYSDKRLPPFDDPSHPEYPRAPALERFGLHPLALECSEPPLLRPLDGELLCLVKPPTTFDFAVTPAQHSFRIDVCVPALLLRWKKHPGLHGRVLLLLPGERPRVLGSLGVGAQQLESAPGWHNFEFKWPEAVDGILQLVLDAPPGQAAPNAADRVALRHAHVE